MHQTPGPATGHMEGRRFSWNFSSRGEPSRTADVRNGGGNGVVLGREARDFLGTMILRARPPADLQTRTMYRPVTAMRKQSDINYGLDDVHSAPDTILGFLLPPLYSCCFYEQSVSLDHFKA